MYCNLVYNVVETCNDTDKLVNQGESRIMDEGEAELIRLSTSRGVELRGTSKTLNINLSYLTEKQFKLW